MNKVTITLPLPHRCLSPNFTVGSRGGRMMKSTQTKKHRQYAGIYAKAEMDVQGVGKSPNWAAASVLPTFFFKDARRRDKDNCLAWIKAYMDGIADAGLVANDADFTYLPVRIEKDAKNPRVELTITKMLDKEGAGDE